MSDPSEITLLLRCHSLPGARFEDRTAVRLGIQKGVVVVEDVPADADGVTFTVPLRVARSAKTGRPNFLGPFAHGTPDGRFLYLCWGERNGDLWDGFRRAKVPLGHLEWERLEQSWATGEPIEIALNMTGRRGGPVCGSMTI